MDLHEMENVISNYLGLKFTLYPYVCFVGISISKTAFVVKGVSTALRLVPEMYANDIGGNGNKMDITATFHTESGTHSGIIQNVDGKNLTDIQEYLEVIIANNFHLVFKKMLKKISFQAYFY